MRWEGILESRAQYCLKKSKQFTSQSDTDAEKNYILLNLSLIGEQPVLVLN